MDGRKRVIRTLRFEGPDRAPRDLWALPGIEMYRKDELDEMLDRFPLDLTRPRVQYGPGERERGTPHEVGSYVDAWGCVWNVAQAGVVGEVKGPPLADWSALDRFRPPDEILENADFSQASHASGTKEGLKTYATAQGAGLSTLRGQRDSFVLAGTTVRPFERLQFLRGTEALFMDLMYQPSELFHLRDMVHEFFMRELEMWVKTDVDGISFMDDWGTMHGLLISPELWRSFFKPLYQDYCDLIHAANKYVFFHSDGNITAIYPDLIEVGIDAVNSQLFCMDIDELGRRFRGRITFWGELDRQHTLPFGDPEDVRAAVRRVRRALDDGRGGVFAQLEWGNDVSAENVAAAFEAWLEPVP